MGLLCTLHVARVTYSDIRPFPSNTVTTSGTSPGTGGMSARPSNRAAATPDTSYGVEAGGCHRRAPHGRGAQGAGRHTQAPRAVPTWRYHFLPKLFSCSERLSGMCTSVGSLLLLFVSSCTRHRLPVWRWALHGVAGKTKDGGNHARKAQRRQTKNTEFIIEFIRQEEPRRDGRCSRCVHGVTTTSVL